MSGEPSPLLRAAGLGVTLGHRRIVDGAGFDVRAGELVVLVGPNGAGKTTLLRALAGLVAAEGMIDIGGRPLARLSLRERARAIAYLPQGHAFHWPLAVADVVALGRHPHADPFGRASASDAAAVAAALAATGIEDLAARNVSTLSGGERARVALARALATGAPLLLADEPTASLDPRHQLGVMAQLRAVAESGDAVLAVTHDLGLAARYAHRVLVMAGGRIVADAAPAEALSPALLAEVFGIEAETVTVDGLPVPVALRPR